MSATVNNSLFSSGNESNYLVARWMTQVELRRQIDDIKRRHGDVKSETSIFTIPSQEEVERNQVSKFWDANEQTVSTKTLISVLKIQATFKMWLMLKNLRQTKNIKFAAEENIILSQVAVRRWLSATAVAKKIKNKETLLNIFSNFCKKVRNGYEVIIFSKKNGQAWKRKMTFSSDLNELSFPSSAFGTKTINLTDIYEVRKGLSGHFYPFARPQHKLWCIHLLHLVGKRLDIEATSANDYRELYLGFQTLITLHISRSPFFIDGNGIPRRAGPSIINYALENKMDGCRSEADLFRFEDAIKQLADEYKTWTNQYTEEKKTWLEALAKSDLDDESEDDESSDYDGDGDDDDDLDYEEEYDDDELGVKRELELERQRKLLQQEEEYEESEEEEESDDDDGDDDDG